MEATMTGKEVQGFVSGFCDILDKIFDANEAKANKIREEAKCIEAEREGKTYMTLEEIFKDLVDNIDGEVITILEIGKALLVEKQNNEKNITWMKNKLIENGYKVQVRR